MAKQTIGIGTTANDRTGDSLRVAFDKVNDNFTELYTGLHSIVSPAASTALDLTKTVHILDGTGYTLADGTEGQVIYLTLATGGVPNDYAVTITSARLFDGTLYEDILFAPFYGSTSGVVTLVFNDGAWSVSAGQWD